MRSLYGRGQIGNQHGLSLKIQVTQSVHLSST